MCLFAAFRRTSVHLRWTNPHIRLSLRKYRTDFNAFEVDTHVKRNLDYLRSNHLYANTTFRDQNNRVSALKEKSNENAHDQILERLGFSITTDNLSKTFVDHLQVIDARAVRSLNKAELQELLYILADSKNRNVSQSFIGVLDFECARRVMMWNAEASLLAFDLWLEWIGHRATHKAFFNVLLNEWKLLSDCRSPRHLVQLLYYIGLRKSSIPNLMAKIEDWLESSDMVTLADKEVVIICQGYFKTSTKLTSQKILFDVSCRVKSILKEKVDEYVEYDLIAMLKVLRHAKYRDDALIAALLKCLKCRFLSPANLTTMAHFMATFANAKTYDRELFCKFEESFLGEIAVHLRGTPPRLKDTARILWALSCLAHCAADRQFEDKVVKHLQKQVRRRLNSKEKHHFIDCLHSLAVFGIFPRHLLQIAFSFDLRNDKIEIQKKPLRQLYFLNESLKIEMPNYEGTVPNFSSEADVIYYENLNSELDHRPLLNMVRLIVRDLCNGDNEFYRCGYLLSHIQIAGIELNVNPDGRICSINEVSDTRCTIEVVDSTFSINGTIEVDGMMSVKLRQLQKIGYSVVKISLRDLHRLVEVEPLQRVTWMRSHLSSSLRLSTLTI